MIEFTAGEGDLLGLEIEIAGKLLLLTLLLAVVEKGEGVRWVRGGGGALNRKSRSSSSSSSSLFWEAITCARRWAAAFAATFWVRLMVDKPPTAPACSREWGCAGDIAGDEEPVLLDPPLHWRPYTGLPVLLSISVMQMYNCEYRRVQVYVYMYRERLTLWRGFSWS